MNHVKVERNKLICDLYHNGKTVREISELIKLRKSVVMVILQRDYEKFYEDAFVTPHDKFLLRVEELKNKFLEIYQPFIYSRADISKKLKCTETQLEYMLNKYNLEFLRLKTYKSQKTLCNVPDEFFDELKEWCIKHNTSIRKVTVTAINEYILKEEMKNKND